MRGDRLVFVGGLHRSGTTPLARVLAAHPEISGLRGTGVAEDEGQHLQDVYPRIRAYGGMGRFANDPRAHLTAASPLVGTANADRLIAAWSPYWDLDRRLLVEKSPANLIMGGFLQALFPGSALIVVVRHPAVVGLAMQKWNPALIARNGRRRTSFGGLLRHWVTAHALLRADAPGLVRLHVLRYEDLVADPAGQLAAVQAFLGLATPLDASAVRGGMNAGYADRWAELGRGPVGRRRRVGWSRRYGAAVAQYGYDLSRITEVAGPLDVAGLFGGRT